MGGGWAEVVARLRANPGARAEIFAELARLDAGGGLTELDVLPWRWDAWGRAHQQMPTADYWETLFLCCGRGGGKTRTGAELTIEAVRDHDVGGHVALIAPTYADIGTVMVEGESGILARSPPWFRPEWKPTRGYGGQLHWPPGPGQPPGPSVLGGVIGHCFTAEKPEQIRGVQFGWFWGDEIAKWDLRGGDGMLVKSNIDFAHRLGRFRRGMFTSTPKPTPLICSLEDRDAKDREEIEDGRREPGKRTVILRRWSTRDNAENLGRETLAKLERDYDGTTKGREELDAEIIRDDPGAMWSQALIAAAHVHPDDVPELRLIVVSVDNALEEAKPGEIDMTSVESRNRAKGPADTAIIVDALGEDGLYYCLGDWTVNASPKVWGERVLEAFAGAWPGRVANIVVMEKNAGGKLIKRNLDIAMRDKGIPPDRVPMRFKDARDAKDVRAEPVHALYEQGRIKHAAPLVDLEFQLSRFKRGKRKYKCDRVDAHVHGITYLIEHGGGTARTGLTSKPAAYT